MRCIILLFIFLCLVFAAFAQCPTSATATAYNANPGFVYLYSHNQCIEGNFATGSIFVYFPQIENASQTPRWTFVSDEGNSASLTALRVYYSDCSPTGLNYIPPGTSYAIVEYAITTEGINLFCPYAIKNIILEIEFTSLTAKCSNGLLQASLITASNSNTNKLTFEYSADLTTWHELIEFAPLYTNSSTESRYVKCIPFDHEGQFYLRAVEEDYSGIKTESLVAPFVAKRVGGLNYGFNIIGQKVSSGLIIKQQ